jgi:hypothetical protein
MLPQKAPKIASAAAAAPVEGRDHISNLPDAVLQHILSFLPAQDVVRTCVLAKNWRHMWESTTVLRFLCGRMKEPESTVEIQEFVDHLLRLRIRGGMPVDTCEFRLLEFDEDEMRSTILWIRIALQCKVRVLQLICAGNCGDIPFLDGHPFFISQYLKKLELYRIDLSMDRDSRFLDFSCCPVLEDLEIVQSYLAYALLISSQSLKRLNIQSCSFGEEWRLPICAPNLVSLWLEVCDGNTPSLQMFPSLLTAFVKIIHSYDLVTLDSDDESNQSIILQGLSEVQNLMLISPETDMVSLHT